MEEQKMEKTLQKEVMEFILSIDWIVILATIAIVVFIYLLINAVTK